MYSRILAILGQTKPQLHTLMLPQASGLPTSLTAPTVINMGLAIATFHTPMSLVDGMAVSPTSSNFHSSLNHSSLWNHYSDSMMKTRERTLTCWFPMCWMHRLCIIFMEDVMSSSLESLLDSLWYFVTALVPSALVTQHFQLLNWPILWVFKWFNSSLLSYSLLSIWFRDLCKITMTMNMPWTWKPCRKRISGITFFRFCL